MHAPDTSRAPALDAYLARFEAALGALPAGERADILLETRSHVAERHGNRERSRRSPPSRSGA